MPNIDSAKKRVDVAERNRQRNVAVKSAMRTAIKKVSVAVAVATPDMTEVTSLLNQAYSLIDRAVVKGIVHKNSGARYKARVAKLVTAPKQTA